MHLHLSESLWFLLLQWAYALWQAVRNTKGFNLCYYSLQWMAYKRLHKGKTVVWVNKDFSSRFNLNEEGWNWVACHDRTKLTMEANSNMNYLGWKDYWFNIRYKKKYYWVHQDVLYEINLYNLRDCVFVANLYDLNSQVSVAQMISEEEAMLLMFNKDMHLLDVDRRTVIYGREFNIEYNSKLSGLLATVPLILQARNWSTASAIASLLLLFIDFLRTPFYAFYVWAFFHFSKFVKLNVFRKRTWLYSLFGLMSDRWRCCDHNTGYAYLTEEDQEIGVSSFVSCKRAEECRLDRVEESLAAPDQQPHFAIRDGVVTSAGYNYQRYVATFKVKKNTFVT